MEKSFYITTPIFYPNAKPHIGHAYTAVICDALARYHKLMGYDTYFLTGTDEHTEKVVEAAKKLGKDPEEYLEEVVSGFKDLYKNLDISYNQFIRTSDKEIHWPGVIEMWNRLVAQDDIYKSEYVGLYCKGCEKFLTEKELTDGKCSDHDIEPEKVSEENYFFRLSKYTDKIIKLIKSSEIRIVPENRKNEMLAFLNERLQDISFSRPKEKMTWGIPVPGDDSQTMYIWMDALTNYITALGFGRGEEDMDFWPGIHVVGKDIVRFHTILWPAMLLSARLPLPKTVFVHGMIISDGKKMSKSLGNIINPQELVDKYGTDGARFLLLKHVHPTEDTDVTWKRLDEWYTADLANGLGNFVSRVMKLAEDNLTSSNFGEYSLKEWCETSNKGEEFKRKMNNFDFPGAIDFVWKYIAEDDIYIQNKKPFNLIKTDLEEGKKEIANLTQRLWRIAVILEPFLPETSEKIKKAILENKKPENLFPRLEKN